MSTYPENRQIVVLMALQASSLAVMSFLHLTGILAGEVDRGAGIAEATICVVLTYGALAVSRRSPHARSTATATLVFAIAGFLIGLSFTISGGDAIDIAYHATVLPLLLVTLAAVRWHHHGPRTQHQS